jgi:DNA-directed RNA polymerase specialized sigma subunit
VAARIASREDVIRALVRYVDWWQPRSASVYRIGGRRTTKGDGIPAGLLETLDERAELCRRMELLSERDRHLLFLWYVEQAVVEDIARTLRLSRRQCFRVRAKALRVLTDSGNAEPQRRR